MRLLAAVVPCLLVGCAVPAPSAPNEAPEESVLRSRFGRHELFVEPENRPSVQADLWRTSDPDGAAIMDDLATVPGSLWLGEWITDVAEEVDEAVTRAGDALQLLVVYNIPDRDCGSMSAGGADDANEYAAFVEEIADGLDGRLALVVLEPDGLVLDCVDDERTAMLADAVDTLEAAGAAVYLDAGHSGWIDPLDMADTLLDAGVDQAHGFALNVAHTEHTADEIGYAEELRAILGRSAHYVIDTGRNGAGPGDGAWCNPLGRQNGDRPTLTTGVRGMDAKLWVKLPGNSDGWCNGGPAPGTWWPEYALDLAQ